jgi:hypothetical protein
MLELVRRFWMWRVHRWEKQYLASREYRFDLWR